MVSSITSIASFLALIATCPEGVIAAAALNTLNCNFQGRFLFKTDEDINRAKEMGIMDLNKK